MVGKSHWKISYAWPSITIVSLCFGFADLVILDSGVDLRGPRRSVPPSKFFVVMLTVLVTA